MSIRPASDDDVGGIIAVAEAAWWDTYPGILDTQQINQGLAALYDADFLERVLTERDDLLFLVRELGETKEAEATDRETDDPTPGSIIAFASAQQTFADEVELYTIFVHPAHQQQGIGTALLEAVTTTARDAGVDHIRTGVLSGNRVARSFFEAHGFERVETVTTEVGGEPHPEDILECQLSEPEE